MKEEMKTKILAVLLVLVIIIVLTMGCLMYKIYKDGLDKENKIAILNNTVNELQNEINSNNTSNEIDSNAISGDATDENNIIGETSYIEISVLDENAQGLIYTEPVQITDPETIKYLVEELNNSEELSDEFCEQNFIDFEGVPEVIFYLENGSAIRVMGGPYYDMFIFIKTNKEDYSEKAIYKLNSSTDLSSYFDELYQEMSE